jgi:hypothetical protein
VSVIAAYSVLQKNGQKIFPFRETVAKYKKKRFPRWRPIPHLVFPAPKVSPSHSEAMGKGFVTVAMKPAASAGGPAAPATAKAPPKTDEQPKAAAPQLVDEKKAIADEDVEEASEPVESTA